jgi:hypothetical protein
MYFLQKFTSLKTEVQVVHYEDIGRVSFFKSSARRLRISVKHDSEVYVAVPSSISLESAGNFVRQKVQWIRKSQLKWGQICKMKSVFNLDTRFQTRDHRLVLLPHKKMTLKALIKEGGIYVYFPEGISIHNQKIQAFIRKSIIAAWRIEAQKHLPALVQQLARLHNFNFTKVNVRHNRTRWGSCSRNNHIQLNLHLMRLPNHLCEYVILHELCHTVHKNHQHNFWHLLNKVSQGRAKILDKELNNYNPEIW